MIISAIALVTEQFFKNYELYLSFQSLHASGSQIPDKILDLVSLQRSTLIRINKSGLLASRTPIAEA